MHKTSNKRLVAYFCARCDNPSEDQLRIERKTGESEANE